jgi:dTDP-4-amino-4,6-dideoxygalactose transaminase
VRLKNATKERRDKIVSALKQAGIGAEVYYMNPIHMMPFYRKYGKYTLPETEKASKQVLSLPIHPGVTPKQTDFIAETVLHLLQ